MLQTTGEVPFYFMAVNAGSSSLKLSLYEPSQSFSPVIKVAAELIGQPHAVIKKTVNDTEEVSPLTSSTVEGVVDEVTGWVFQQIPRGNVFGAGHRVVHGGSKYHTPTVISDEVIAELQSLRPFDEDHLPFEIAIIQKLQDLLPDAVHVACFDTGFHHDLPKVSQILPIPRTYWKQGLRRYGFHGLSYEYLLSEIRRLDSEEIANGKIIFAHLGSGASLAATKAGRSIDTTMGFSPASGIMMSTRSGDLDPGVFVYLQKNFGLSPDQLNDMVNHQSGLYGISETSADMYTLLQNEHHDERAKEAVDLFCYQVKKTIGAFAAALGGVDTLVFSGGIGQNAPLIRERICQGLEFLGIALDPEANTASRSGISAPHGRVRVRVIQTDEQVIIAKQALEVINKKDGYQDAHAARPYQEEQTS